MTTARSITVELPSEDLARLEAEAERRGVSPQALARQFVGAGLAAEGPGLRELLDQVRSRSTLTADEAMALAYEELHAMRAEKAAGK